MFEPWITLFLFAVGIWFGFELRDYGVHRWMERMEQENDELRSALLEKMK